MTEQRIGYLTWIKATTQNGLAWYSHRRQYRLRARQIGPSTWVAGHEVAGGQWAMIASGPTLAAVSARAEEWVRK